MTAAVTLSCFDVDARAWALAESGALDGAVALLVEHAAGDADPGTAHHAVFLKARLDAFATGLLRLPADDLFARRAAAAHVASLLFTPTN